VNQGRSCTVILRWGNRESGTSKFESKIYRIHNDSTLGSLVGNRDRWMLLPVWYPCTVWVVMTVAAAARYDSRYGSRSVFSAALVPATACCMQIKKPPSVTWPMSPSVGLRDKGEEARSFGIGAARADRESGEMASIARRRHQRNDGRVCRKWRANVTFLAAATCTMLLPAADCFLGPGPGIAIAAKSSGLSQHSFRGGVRGGGYPGTAMALFWPRAPSLSLTSIGGGEGDKKVRRVWRGQGEEDSISIRTMVESDMNGAESKLIEVWGPILFFPTRFASGPSHHPLLSNHLQRTPIQHICTFLVPNFGLLTIGRDPGGQDVRI
jgi:hypothetical protein